MSVKELEQRVIALERQVQRMQLEREAADSGRRFDWRAAVEKFKGDEDVLAVLREAMRLREKERRAVRKPRSKARKSTA